MSAEFVALHESGLSLNEIARLHGVTRNVVVGAIWRARHPAQRRLDKYPRSGFRDPEYTKMAVEMANRMGLARAAAVLSIDRGQLCRWRKRLQQLETA